MAQQRKLTHGPHYEFRVKAATAFLQTATNPNAPNDQLTGSFSQLCRIIGRSAANSLAHISGKPWGESPTLAVTGDKWSMTREGAARYDEFLQATRDRVAARVTANGAAARDAHDSGTDLTSNAAAQVSTGPQPTNASYTVERSTDRTAWTYVLRFGKRDLWKVGHATDLDARLSDIRKHVPEEVLGENWSLCFQQPWPCEVQAYEMEQRVLKHLSAQRTTGERVRCKEGDIKSVWAALGPHKVRRPGAQ